MSPTSMAFWLSVSELMMFVGAVVLLAALLLELSKPSPAVRMKSGRASRRRAGRLVERTADRGPVGQSGGANR